MIDDPTVFEWFSSGSAAVASVAAVVSAIAVVWALVYAKRQISAWRSEAKHRRRAEAAEEVLVAAEICEDAFKSVRSPMVLVPQAEIGNQTYAFRHRLERLVGYNKSFESLRFAAIRAKHILKLEDVDKAIEEIFDIRITIYHALDYMIENFDGPELLRETDREILKEKRGIIAAQPKRNDLLHKRLREALDTLNRLLGPIVRYED